MCQVPKCGRPFHLVCGIAKGCTFTKDRVVYCNRCVHTGKDESQSNIGKINKSLMKIDLNGDDSLYNLGSLNKLGNVTIGKLFVISHKDYSFEKIDIGLIKILNYDTNECLFLNINQKGATVRRGIVQFDNIKNILSNVLFVWSKENPKLSYNQGMNDILSILFLLYSFGLPKGVSDGVSGVSNSFPKLTPFLKSTAPDLDPLGSFRRSSIEY